MKTTINRIHPGASIYLCRFPQQECFFVVALGLTPTAVFAQNKPAKAPAQDPSTYMQVHAPFAEDLVNKVKAAHSDEIVKLGIHAVPPGETDNVIIANIATSKIGKKSSD